MGRFENWSEIEKLLRFAAEPLKKYEDEFNQISELLDHNELGLAFELLVDVLDEKSLQISTAHLDSAKAAGEMMGLQSNSRYLTLLKLFS